MSLERDRDRVKRKMNEILDKKFMDCGENPDGMDCWNCSKEQEAYCEEQFRTKLIDSSFNQKNTTEKTSP